MIGECLIGKSLDRQKPDRLKSLGKCSIGKSLIGKNLGIENNWGRAGYPLNNDLVATSRAKKLTIFKNLTDGL